MEHIDALRLRLSNERVRLQNATNEGERALRSVWVKQLEKEVGAESAMTEAPMSDEDLLASLTA
jgi:hypothetical protein